ncbi:hypothetical protein SMC26_00750 [Actinomadura fulvescens]
MAGATTSIAPYLITAGSTLAGVLITGILAEYRERRRSAEERRREEDRLAEERWKWLRQERRESYARLISLGYQAASLFAEAADVSHKSPDKAKKLWKSADELRDAIHSQVADVELVGSEAVISASHSLRRTMRRAPGLLVELRENERDALNHKVRSLYGATNDLVDIAKRDLNLDMPVKEIEPLPHEEE